MKNWKINTITFAPMRITAFILLIIAWSNGTIHGILAWILLFLILDVSANFTRN